METELFIKGKKVEKFENVKIIKKEEKKVNKEQIDKVAFHNTEIVRLKEENSDSNKHSWFKWRSNSCRYDSFSLIYALLIKPKIEEENETPENYIIDYLNK